MNFAQLIQSLNDDTLRSLMLFRPELVLCATIVLVLLLNIVPVTRGVSAFLITFIGALVALVLTILPWQGAWQDPSIEQPISIQTSGAVGTLPGIVGAADEAKSVAPNQATGIMHQELFTGMLVFDGMSVYFRALLMLFLVLFVLFTRISGVPDRDAAIDVYPLVVGATLGMCLMVSANHMLIVFLAVEMASVPSYVLAGMLKGRRRSSEAALKYAVYGAGTAGVMLYGISLLGGVLGSFHLPTMAAQLGKLLAAEPVRSMGADKPLVLMLGGLMLMVGIAFKLSAVPFHFWCPDVFEGASAEVDAFLSVASKAAALALLVRVAVGLGTIPYQQEQSVAAVAYSQAVDPVDSGGANPVPGDVRTEESLVGDEPGDLSGMPSQSGAAPIISRLGPAQDFISKLIALLAVITCTFGNLAAYGQTNIKRLLAYSTIAHAGYMMMPVAAAMALADADPAGARAALSALAFYIAAYFFMNLGAFAIVAFLRNAIGSEEIADYAGLIRRTPITVICFSAILFSLVGMPPFSGFIGKLLVFASLMNAGLLTVLVIGGLNTVLSLVYYLRVVKVMTMDPEPEQRLPVQIPFIPGVFTVALTVPVVVLGFDWNGLNSWAQTALSRLLS
ncbi:MAG TPA: NADH-quinone oxidoreductase subunit N [Pirellulales bacterium]|nr:NADH-quinone oxidoreductase subunit N [Pirellulales bacterium]